MQALVDLAHGFAVALSPANLSWALVGSVLGTAIGVLPGIGSRPSISRNWSLKVGRSRSQSSAESTPSRSWPSSSAATRARYAWIIASPG